jgi:hypothetical protein
MSEPVLLLVIASDSRKKSVAVLTPADIGLDPEAIEIAQCSGLLA